MKLGAVTMAYRDQETIRGTLSCLAPFVDKHIVFINNRPYHGEYETPDNTESICREFSHVEVIKGNWPEHTLRNIGINICSDCDWMIGFDSDEMITKEDFIKLKQILSQTKHDAVGFVSKVYWRNLEYRFEPDPDHIKVCIIRPSGKIRYIENQCINSSSCVVINYRKPPYITHHHLSWCEPKNILRKVTHCDHANQYKGREWYEKYFKDWKEGDPVYQPYMTKWEAVKDPLPEELKNLL